MKIFVTGGTGFIGGHVLNALHLAGHEVVALRRSAESKPKVHLSIDPLWINGSMAELSPSQFEGCDALVHLAAHGVLNTNDSLQNCLQYNVIEPEAMIRAAAAAGVQKIIFAGSCFEYGLAAEKYEEVPVEAPCEPAEMYGISKLAATMMLRILAKELHLKAQVLRLFHVYGEGESEGRFWPSLSKAAHTGENFKMSDGLQIRDFIYVKDVAERFVKALSFSMKEGDLEISNVGTGKAKMLSEFAQEEWRRLNAQGQIELGAFPMRRNEIMRLVPKI